MTWSKLEACRLCEGPLHSVLRLGESPPANDIVTGWTETQESYPLELVQCGSCAHVQMAGSVPPSLLFRDDYAYRAGTSPVFCGHLERLARQLQARLFPGDLVVEIGSNDGTLLRCFDPGIRILGIDPARNLANDATAAGSLTHPWFFTPAVARAVVRAASRASLILATNSLAHVENMHEVAEGVRVLLAETGTLVVEVAYLPDLIRTNNFAGVYQEHVHQWALGPLIKFWSDHGMTLYDAERIDTQGGSIRYYVGKGRKAATDRLHDLLRAEDSLPAALAEWPARVAESRTAIGDAVRGLKEAGHSIAGYGASAKSTTLLHSCGLGRAEIDFICDLAPSKIGKFTPGTHIPIVATSELESRNPDYVVLLSSNFSEAIRGQHPSYTGKWLDPLPMPRVVE